VRKLDQTVQLIVPDILRKRLFDQAHAGPLAAHLGVDKTLQQLKQSYYWPGMRRVVTCEKCARSKGPPSRPHGKLQKIFTGAPLDLVTIDILSGLPTAPDDHLLVVVDCFSKWMEAFPLTDQEASTCMRAMYNGFFSRFGLPRQLHSDQ